MAPTSRVGANLDRMFPREGEIPMPHLSSQAPPANQDDSVRRATRNAGGVGRASTVNGTGNGSAGSNNNPNNEEGMTRDGGHADLARKASAHGSEIEMRYDAFVWVDFVRKKWVLFFLGNLISAAVVVCELFQVGDCFEDVTEHQVDGTIGITRDTEASLRLLVIAILFFGLVTEMVVAVVLSFVYRVPLDVKSMTKISPVDIRGFEASIAVNLVAPFSWGVIYTCGSFVSLQLDTFSSCGGEAGSGLGTYLLLSGWCMLVVGLGMLGLSGYLLIFIFSCGSTAEGGGAKTCCVADRVMYGHRIFSNAALFDVFWQLQGAVWLYRTGSVGALGLVLLLAFGIVGGGFASVGSRAPVVKQEASGAPSLVPTETTDATDRA